MIDGRKRTAMYFGDTRTDAFLPWYHEVRENLILDDIPLTHLGYATKTKPLSHIRIAKRVQKRYLESMVNNPDDTEGLEIYFITDDVEHWANQYSFTTGMFVNVWKDRTPSILCAKVSIDFSMLTKLDFDKYCNIVRKYTDWEQEVIFDCSEYDIPFNYSLNKNPEVFKEINIISDIKR